MNKILDPFKALSDRNRLRVVAALVNRQELCACQISGLLQVTGATASRHMEILIRAGLVESRKDGRWVYYRLSSSFPGPLLSWLETELEKNSEIRADRRALSKILECD